jgi:hypothetical protein
MYKYYFIFILLCTSIILYLFCYVQVLFYIYSAIFIPPLPEGRGGYTVLLYPRSLKGEGVCCFIIPPAPWRGRGYTVLPLSICPSVQDIFHRIFLSNCWWQKSDILSQASYRYTILWVTFLDPSDSYFLFADLVGLYTHWIYMHIFLHIFLSNYRWQRSDIWSQASYRYPISWEAFLDPSDSYFLFADIVGFYTHWTYMHIFRHIFLSNYWWQKSDIWSQASYRYPISWEAFLNPSDSYFLSADFVDFYTHWTYMLIFRRIFLSNYWWQKSDIWSQASYRYPISWKAFLDPSDSYFLFADFVDFLTHWTYILYMTIFSRILLSNYWWQKSDIWSLASYMYPILWEAFFDPSDSYFLFAEERGYHTCKCFLQYFYNQMNQSLIRMPKLD